MLKDEELYIRAILVKDDIKYYHKLLDNQSEIGEQFRLIKYCLVHLNVLRESINDFNFIIKDRYDLSSKAREIKRKLEFVNHLRNKISGHLDSKVLNNAIQWEPHIFHVNIKDEETVQLLLIRKSLLESAINSYIDNDGNHKVFRTEIDFNFPKDKTLFLNFLGELNESSIAWLDDMAKLIKEKIDFWDNSKIIEMAKRAGETDFNLKSNI
ncbi:hypothetical protein OCK74_27235 [Chitinophagaceae bacterium LB-8]|uniref:Uncharacterized protein n=1 Tax=Paraflavisolibacter caeni TaxID=2982496 RepID=A0A9X2Y2P3_9BACT|nr:hypothetical protein [Paraflavisolibacter caeni]MCU7552843.1 hypothetical protein [Paraflavisolibacter caeni]